MLNRICILSSKWADLLHTILSSDECLFLFVADYNSKTLRDLFQMVYISKGHFKKNQKFSVCFNWKDNLPQPNELADESFLTNTYLCSLAFHPSFYIKHNKPYLFFERSENSRTSIQQLLMAVSDSLTGQSFAQPEMIEIKRAGNRENHLSVFKIKNDLKASLSYFYSSCFLNKGIYNQFVLIELTSSTVFQTIKETLSETEQEFYHNRPLAYKQAQQLNSAIQENESLYFKLRIYEENIRNFKRYLNLIQESDKVSIITDFYQYEYEILPSWYKKFGHIIKVLMGKRTFKSLFNDNVKKYKD